MPFLPPGYGDTCRDPWIERIASASHSRLLDIGCGMGATASTALRRGLCSEAHGVEIDPVAAEAARQTLTSVICADIETTELPFPDNHFDPVFLSEVLEHLSQPSSALREVFRVSMPGATILAGTPNIASLKIIRSLLKGRFDYTDTGVMDRTHVYWFTPATLREAFEEAGFSVKSVDRVNRPSRLQQILAAVTPRRLQYLYWTQVDLLASKPPQPPERAG